MKFILAPQRSDIWYQARVGRVTGSDVTNVITRSKVKNKFGESAYLKGRDDYKKIIVAERIYGQIATPQRYVTEEMKWGIANERAARTLYKLKTLSKVTEEGFIQDDKLMVGVSTDGLVNNEGNLEIKCLTPVNHLYEIVRHNAMPDDYKPQVQMGLWVTHRKWCDFVGYDSRAGKGLDIFSVRVLRDEPYIKMMKAEVIKFLKEVDEDIVNFLAFLPLAEKTCTTCGNVFKAQLPQCLNCNGFATIINKILKPAKTNLMRGVL